MDSLYNLLLHSAKRCRINLLPDNKIPITCIRSQQSVKWNSSVATVDSSHASKSKRIIHPPSSSLPEITIPRQPHHRPLRSLALIVSLLIAIAAALLLLLLPQHHHHQAMPFPAFLSRLVRPFTTSTTMSIAGQQGSSPAGAATTTTTALPPGAQKATVAAGCFWGVEHLYRKHFGGAGDRDRGLIDARVGYIGGDLSNPSYRAVCGGRTGHAEALQVVFDPSRVTYRQLLEFFYRMHDPTTADRQGPDAGPQYRSAVFYHDEDQRRVAEEVTRLANEQWYGGRIVTQIVPAGTWWDAEQYHQLYLDKNPSGYECPSHFLRTFPELQG